jgi:hypothetical protein
MGLDHPPTGGCGSAEQGSRAGLDAAGDWCHQLARPWDDRWIFFSGVFLLVFRRQVDIDIVIWYIYIDIYIYNIYICNICPPKRLKSKSLLPFYPWLTLPLRDEFLVAGSSCRISGGHGWSFRDRFHPVCPGATRLQSSIQIKIRSIDDLPVIFQAFPSPKCSNFADFNHCQPLWLVLTWIINSQFLFLGGIPQLHNDLQWFGVS